jgi:Uma2 family endonuclease
MATVITDRRYTPDDLLKMPDGDRFELLEGQLVEKDMSAKACRVVARICAALVPFVEANELGSVFGSTATYRCFADDPDRVRKPDVSFVHRSRWNEEYEEGHVPIAPDLAVEVVSPNDLHYDVERKVAEFLSAGVKLIWVINPEEQTVQVFRHDGTTGYLRADAELTGEAVLPGFRCRIAELFKPAATGPAA